MRSTSLTVPATEANRSFSKLLRAAREGVRIIITSHGEPVAELGPVNHSHIEDARQQRMRTAQERLEARWATQEPVVIGPWTRADLYDRD